MDNEVKKLLNDILVCINTIETYIGTERVYALYDANLFLQDAVERNLITIGEATNALLRRKPDISITNARRAVDA